MAIQVSGTEVISNARALTNIASADATTVATLNAAGVGGGFKPVSVSGTTQALNLGSYNFFNANTLSTNATLSFTSVPTNALWDYTYTAGIVSAYSFSAPVPYNGLKYYVGGTINGANSEIRDVKLSADGTKMYVLSDFSNTVYQFTLSTPSDVTTATYSGLSSSLASQGSAPRSIWFSPDGLRMYHAHYSQGRIFQSSLSTAWNISTRSYTGNSILIYPSLGGDPEGAVLSTDGTKMYVVGTNYGYIYQYNLGTTWDVSTASYSGTRLYVSQETTQRGVLFNPTGTVAVVVGTSNKAYRITLSTPWNIGTGTYDTSITSAGNTWPEGAAWSPDGSMMYIASYGDNTIYQYTTGLGPAITTPASVQNPPTISTSPSDQVTYTFVTNDGGTTVKLIGEEIT